MPAVQLRRSRLLQPDAPPHLVMQLQIPLTAAAVRLKTRRRVGRLRRAEMALAVVSLAR